jgi:hypothetical protein
MADLVPPPQMAANPMKNPRSYHHPLLGKAYMRTPSLKKPTISAKGAIKPCRAPYKNPGGSKADGVGWVAQAARRTDAPKTRQTIFAKRMFIPPSRYLPRLQERASPSFPNGPAVKVQWKLENRLQPRRPMPTQRVPVQEVARRAAPESGERKSAAEGIGAAPSLADQVVEDVPGKPMSNGFMVIEDLSQEFDAKCNQIAPGQSELHVSP